MTPNPVPVTVKRVPPALAPVDGVTLKKAGVKVMDFIPLMPAGKPVAVTTWMFVELLSFMFVILNTTELAVAENVVCLNPSTKRLIPEVSPSVKPVPASVAVANPFVLSSPAVSVVTDSCGTVNWKLQEVASLQLASNDAARNTRTYTVATSFAVKPVALTRQMSWVFVAVKMSQYESPTFTA